MACPLLDKLPAELRARIYGYALYFDDVPLRHITQLRPFVKKLTGVDGELPFSYENASERDPALDWVMCDGDAQFGNMPVDTGVLATCKTAYTEAIKVFYAQNIISVDIELFKLQHVNSPAASDLSLTKRLVVTFNSASKWREQFSRSFNTINLRNLFTRCAATFPGLESIVVHTDGATLPCTSLIDIFQDCHNSNMFTTIDFCNVGQFIATTHSGLTLTVKSKELAELWQEICDLSSSTEMRVSQNFKPTNNFLANVPRQRNLSPQVNQTSQAFLIKMVYDEVKDDDTSERMDTFRKAMVQHSPNRAMPYLNDNVFWTNLASPYVWYAPN